MIKNYTFHHLKAVTLFFGAYLVCHFGYLVYFSSELFSAAGMFPAHLSPTYGYFPNIINLLDTPWFVTSFTLLLLALSIAVVLGTEKKWIFLLLWFGWACLLNRNPLIRNPGMPYVGWMLLAFAVIYPVKDRVSFKMNKWIYWGAWSLLSIGYTLSGIDKLNSPSWLSGRSIQYLLENPLARDYFLTHWLAQQQWLTPLLTYFSLAGELLFLPLAFFRKTRPFIWLALLGMQFGILFVVDFADLTFGMLMIHLFVFDPNWIPCRFKEKYVVYFDGVCNLCNGSVDFLITEDRSHLLHFSPLQGKDFSRHNIQVDQNALDTFYLWDGERMYTKSQAWLKIMWELGGLWTLLVLPFKIVPIPLLDWGYDLVAKNRYSFFGKRETCRLPTPEERQLFLD